VDDLDSSTQITHIVLLSLGVSGTALLISSAVGIPIGVWLGFRRFVARRLVIAFIYTGMGFPPVVIGLLVYLLLSRDGPLGWLGWLYTPKAMVLAQVIISFPIITAFTMAAVMGVTGNVRLQLLTLGASRLQATLAVLSEARIG